MPGIEMTPEQRELELRVLKKLNQAIRNQDADAFLAAIEELSPDQEKDFTQWLDGENRVK